MTSQQRDAVADLALDIRHAMLAWIGKHNDGADHPDIARLIVALYHYMPHLEAALEREIGERLPRLGRMLTPEEIARRHKARRKKPPGGTAHDAAAKRGQ